MNSLQWGDEDLIPVDYSDILEKILGVLQDFPAANLFKLQGDGKRLLIDIDALAAQVAMRPVQHPLASFERLAHSATINFTPAFQQQFPHQIRQIRAVLRRQLHSILGLQYPLEHWVKNLTTPLESEAFQGSGEQLGFKYDFSHCHQNLEKQKLTLERLDSSSPSLLKLHKLTITVRDTAHFQEQLTQGLANYIEEKAENRSEQEELTTLLDELVANETSDFHRLLRLVDLETLGKLKKEAKLIYLEYLCTQIQAVSTHPALVYLQDLIRRLRLIEAYIRDPEKTESDYEVNYAGFSVNYRDIFSRAEVLDALPIIPIIAGYLGETTEGGRGTRKYVFGLKLKFDNPVQSRGGDQVFDYNLSLLKPDSEEHQAGLSEGTNAETFVRKVLTRAFLYYFVFASRCNPLAEGYQIESELQYNPILGFESQVLPILKGADEEKKKKFFQNLIRGFETFNIKHKIEQLSQLLKTFLSRQSILPPRTETRHLSIKRGLLETASTILTTGQFFKDVLERNPKQALQYISVGDPKVDETAICQLPATFTLEDIRYFATKEKQSFSMEYNIKGIEAMPVLFVPKADHSRKIYKEKFLTKLVVFPYDNQRCNSETLELSAIFVYKFTVILLTYICLEILLENASSRLFMPMVRLHEGDHAHPSPVEKFMAHLSKVLSHLLSEKYRASSQGFRIRQNLSKFTIRNGLSSLYSVLPKTFRFPATSPAPGLEKLALIIVSSRESDARKGNANRRHRKACLLGEVVGIHHQKGSIQVELLKTFSENYEVGRIYSDPPILADIVSQLYQQGYRHFLYIAQAPYSSTLHITQTDEDAGLFFMSKSLIRTLKGERRDLKIYPIFFDKYYVHSPENHRGKSFYIQDVREFEDKMFQDLSQQAVMFFNLFNGIKVEQGGKNFYNGVIAYSTLLNIYQGILDDQDIRQGLLYENPIKDTLLNALTIFHFSRYEARQQISLKLDPYDKIIGEESVGALSLFNHIEERAEFNSLAFLTAVREVLQGVE